MRQWVQSPILSKSKAPLNHSHQTPGLSFIGMSADPLDLPSEKN
jgi:hypothetical protein